ncbi:LysR family transcriptional regulator [Photobacterium kishitanii]|uniref:LysR family transcriptional regulator n=1 Tax=Photobacterium kishitanii TaxID=318456 RepID=UPI002739D510|nr:LysR family transcriptional regulator [Photobacterium kishitanii]
MINSHTKLRYQRLPAQQSIRVFEAAARHLNFTLAAEELAMTQSGISKQIKALESFLNTSLFIRKGQKIYLTDMGRLFYDRCVEALDCLQHAVDEIRSNRTIAITGSTNIRMSLADPSHGTTTQ